MGSRLACKLPAPYPEPVHPPPGVAEAEEAWLSSPHRKEAWLAANASYARLRTNSMHATTDHYISLWPTHRMEPPALSTALRMFGRSDEVSAAADEWERRSVV